MKALILCKRMLEMGLQTFDTSFLESRIITNTNLYDKLLESKSNKCKEFARAQFIYYNNNISKFLFDFYNNYSKLK